MFAIPEDTVYRGREVMVIDRRLMIGGGDRWWRQVAGARCLVSHSALTVREQRVKNASA